MTYLVTLAFIAILGSLVAALVFMMRRPAGDEAALDDDQTPPRSRRMARALAFRVGFSVALFVLVLLAYALGWIQPTGIAPGR